MELSFSFWEQTLSKLAWTPQIMAVWGILPHKCGLRQFVTKCVNNHIFESAKRMDNWRHICHRYAQDPPCSCNTPQQRSVFTRLTFFLSAFQLIFWNRREIVSISTHFLRFWHREENIPPSTFQVTFETHPFAKCTMLGKERLEKKTGLVGKFPKTISIRHPKGTGCHPPYVHHRCMC